MRPETLLDYVRAVPFRPFRIVLNSGRSYDVWYPQMLRVTRDHFVLFHAETPDAPHDRFDTVGLLLVERVEHLEVKAAT
jgi:hypothetical protein